MYRHEKIAQNSTALENIIQGFEQDPSALFQSSMLEVAKNMQDLPFYRQGIECYCPKFILFEQQWIGSVVTPWMLSVVILPGKDQQWEAREIGDKLTVQLPYKALTFTVSGMENIPQYLSCSLHSPIDPSLTNAQAIQLSQDCLRMILSMPTASPTFDSNRRNLFSAMVK
ncbi:hydrogenase [Rodentibacter trehalosifermentans]|uniref:Hydrogenase n=1 Tax=Rodentibacter trehalosifermentans TaxID=1908263 RepID=A0A1V3IYN2_9PAST|nr:hydrogenase-2 assembly chaperone [Rodentibacter trehalosifermentans]OOF47508.1 hydrogenase [Rodentibacter trehalosifermentans]